MGNKLGRRRQVVDEKYTKPQGLYEIKDVDQKKLRKLILESKLAPCFPGGEESVGDLEECPICFLFYPSLNRSRCCMKSICTECFLQMKSPNSTRPTQCPFCKTSNYAVEYRGVKTKEEKGMEQIEEQRVIEAKIRMRQQEIRDEEERMLKRQELSSSSQNGAASEDDYGSAASLSSSSPTETEDIDSADDSDAAPIIRHPTSTGMNRDNDFELDLEEIMVMEAIWLSIQENGRKNNSHCGDAALCEQLITEARCPSPAAVAAIAGSSSLSSPSRGLACAIASLVENQQKGGESSSNYSRNLLSSKILRCSNRGHNSTENDAHHNTHLESFKELSSDCRVGCLRDDGELMSEVSEAGTSYASSEVPDAGLLPLPHKTGNGFPDDTGPVVSGNFEEQMMLAVAVSLADGQAMSSLQELAWQ